MKNELERAFLRCGRRREALFYDDMIRLTPREYSASVARLCGARSLVFDIIDAGTGRRAGEIALRIGEGDCLFYLGHVGYHIDPPFRGRHEALRACRLCLPMFTAFQMRSFVITTDIDNLPSIKTCERLGCALESIVEVPEWCRREFALSAGKRRYVYEL